MYIFSGSTNQKILRVKWNEISALVGPPSPTQPPSNLGNLLPLHQRVVQRHIHLEKLIIQNFLICLKKYKARGSLPSVERCNQMCTHGLDDEEHKTDFQDRILKIYNLRKAIRQKIKSKAILIDLNQIARDLQLKPVRPNFLEQTWMRGIKSTNIKG